MSVEASEPLFVTVVNDEGQYSVWPEKKALPAGWRQEGEAAPREACLQYIETVWTDMRPKSLRSQMDAAGE